MNRLLIANRGEIAVRILTTAQDLGIACISVYPEDDGLAQHVRLADDHYCLPGAGAAAYLDIDAIIAAAVATNADAIHPGAIWQQGRGSGAGEGARGAAHFGHQWRHHLGGGRGLSKDPFR